MYSVLNYNIGGLSGKYSKKKKLPLLLLRQPLQSLYLLVHFSMYYSFTQRTDSPSDLSR